MGGDLPSGWARLYMGDVFAERKEPGRPDLPVMSVTMNDGVVDRSSLDRRVESDLTPEQHRAVRRGDLVYNTMRMWQGVSGIAPVDGMVSPAYVVCSPNGAIDPAFGGYLLKSGQVIRVLEGHSQGLTDDRLRLYFHHFARIPLPLPPLPEQKKIAAILSSMDEAIQATQAVIEQTRRVKEGLLQELLTRGIGHTRFKQTLIGEIPEEWEVRFLGDLLVETSYGTSDLADGSPHDLPILRIPNVTRDGIDLSDLKFIRLPEKDRERFTTRAGDILVIRTNGNPNVVGRAALVPDQFPPHAYASYLIKLVPDTRHLNPEFATEFINSRFGRQYLDRESATSAGNFNVNSTQLRGMPIPLPPVSEQGAIAEKLASVDHAAGTCQATLQAACRLKSALLHDLLTGAVRVTP